MMQMSDKMVEQVEAIAREAIEQFMRAEKSPQTCLVLAPSYLLNLQIVRKYLSPMTDSFSLTIVHSGLCDLTVFPSSARLVNINEGTKCGAVISSLSSFDKIVCLQPPIGLLEKVLSADDSEFYAFVLVQAALRGIPVSLSVCTGQNKGKKGAFFEKIRSLVDGLEDMGFQMLSDGSLPAVDNDERTDIDLLTEEDVILQGKGGYRTIKAGRNTIVTPLARDKIRELGIVLEQA